jgi:hypothetical protein
VAEGVQQLDEAFGPELLLRNAAWLTFKESRASFAIEHEADQSSRVKRFAAADHGSAELGQNGDHLRGLDARLPEGPL